MVWHMRINILHRKPVLFAAAVVCLLYAFVLPAWTKNQDTILIEVRNTAEVDGPDILLKDIATITAPDFFKEELARIDLGRAPRPGRVKPLTGDRITAAVNDMGLDGKSISVQVPKQVFVKRASQELDPARVEKEAVRFLSGVFSGKEVQLTAFKVRGLELYPQGELAIIFDTRYSPSSSGRLSLHADVWVNGSRQDRLSITGRLTLYRSVVVAVKRLERGQAIAPGDVALQSMDIFGQRSDLLYSLDQVTGMVMTRTVAPGQCVTQDEFRQAPTIEKGSVVKLVASKNRLSIVTLGVLKEDGFKGESVEVENLTSGKVVRGLVQEDGTVAVVF